MTKPLVPFALAIATLTAAPALADQHRHDNRGRTVVTARPYGRVYVAPRRAYAPRYYYYRPYYSFRPRLSIGFGISVGYPVTYPVYAPYYYGYAPPAYSYPPPYGQTYPSQPYPPQGYPSQGYPSQSYPPQSYPQQGYPQQNSPGYPDSGTSPQGYPSYDNNSVQAQPRNLGNAGGVSFEISPSDAEVWVDGSFRGTVEEFGPQTEPLRLAPGRHHIELRAGDMQPMAIDATVLAGQVIPYRGTLTR